MSTRALTTLCAVGALALIAGCGGDTPSEPGSIGISLASTAGSVTPGSSTTVGITVTRTNFSDDIALAVSGAPAGVTTSLSVASLPSGTSSSTLTINVAPNAAAGASTITVTASGSGVDSKSATYALTVTPPPAYTMTLASTSGTIAQNASTTVNVALARTNFTGAVTLAASGVPTGASVTFAPNPATADASVMTLNAGTAAVGAYTITVTGSATGMTDRTATFALTVAPAPSYTMTLASTSATLAQNTSSTVNIALARTNFTGAVTLAASGVPTGASVTFAPNPATADASVMTVNAGTAAAGTYTITVTGSAAGTTNRTATFALTVTAAPAPTTVVYSFCNTAPLWFAYQNGTSGPWTAVTPGANNTFTFSVNGPSGVAFVEYTAGNSAAAGYSTTVIYGSATDLQARTVVGSCISPTTKTVNGSVAGLGTGDRGDVSFDSDFALAFADGPFTLSHVREGTYDLLSTLTGSSGLASKMIIRRTLNPPDNSTLAVLDFGSAEAFATTAMTLTFTGLNTVQPFVVSSFQSPTGTSVSLGMVTAVGGTAATVGVPLARLASGDLHSAFASLDEGAFFRQVSTYFHAPGDRTIAFGPSVSIPVASTVATSPYVRTQLAAASQPPYSTMVSASFSQGGMTPAASDRSVDIIMTPAYLGGVPSTWTLTVPDLSAAGYSATYALASGVTTSYIYSGWGFNPTGMVTDGSVQQYAGYQGTMIPSVAGTIAPRSNVTGNRSARSMIPRIQQQLRGRTRP